VAVDSKEIEFMSDVKRLHYFNHQFLEERDFRDEQAYHNEMRYRHNRWLHSWGVVTGLQVERSAHQTVTVQPGMALDSFGREIVLLEAITKELSAHSPNGHVYLTTAYSERFDEEDRQGEGAKAYTRVVESPEIAVHGHRPATDGSVIALALVHFDGESNIREIDSGIQRRSTAAIVAGAVGTEELRDQAVTEQKLSEEIRARMGRTRGWVRLPFKPVPIERVRIDNPDAEIRDTAADFDIGFIPGIGYSRAGSRGARGTMSIPVPAGARRIRNLRLAGWTRSTIELSLYRTGWRNNRCEETEIHGESIAAPADGHLNHFARMDHKLDDDDALAAVVGAKGPARIFLLAAEFE
jgi:hypothetical protein